MRLLFTLVLSLSFASVAAAADIKAGGFEAGTLYNLHVSAPVDVGSGLVSVTVSVENISGDAANDVNSITDAQFGEVSGLHHDFGGGGFAPTPLGASFAAFSLPPSTVDSHFLPDGEEASPVITPALESGPLAAFGAPTQLGAAGGVTGLASGISGQFGFQSGTIVNLAQLVVPAEVLAPGGMGIDFGLSVADANVDSAGERFVGNIVGIPEPTTAILAMLGLVGVAARRRS